MPNPIQEQIRDTAQTEATKEDMLFATLAGLAGFHASMSAIGLARSYMKVCDKSGLKMNPYFVQTGKCGPSPKTDRMLANRKLKGLGVAGARVGLAAVRPAIAPIPTPLGTVLHTSATASTGVHLRKLSKLLGAYTPFATGDEQMAMAVKWLQLAIEVKLRKLAFRGTEAALATTSTILSFTGVGLVGTLPIIMVSVQLELARLGISNKYGVLCKIAAMELQWAAFLEVNGDSATMPTISNPLFHQGADIKALEQRTTLLGAAITQQTRRRGLDAQTGHKGLGPATRIIKEIMAKHTLQGQFVAGHDYLAMIDEPAGWNAIAAKLMNI